MSQIIEGLLSIGAVSLNFETPYVWASGIHAPIYCDNRKALGHYALRAAIAAGLASRVREAFPEVELIGGTATAGIPHATSVADRLALGLVYFRSQAKDHGKKAQVEGDYVPGQKIVIVEDLISTGGSVLESVRVAREAGLTVLGVVSIFDYQLAVAAERFAEAGVTWSSLAGFSDLVTHLGLDQAKRDFVDCWRQDPYNASIWE